jgi:hypothetical protein
MKGRVSEEKKKSMSLVYCFQQASPILTGSASAHNFVAKRRGGEFCSCNLGIRTCSFILVEFLDPNQSHLLIITES